MSRTLAMLTAIALVACDGPPPPPGDDSATKTATGTDEPPVLGFGLGGIELPYDARPVGSARCGECHFDEHDASATHHMARTSTAVTAASRDEWFSEELLRKPTRWPGEEPTPAPVYERTESGVAIRGVDAAGIPSRAVVGAVFGSGNRGLTPVAFEPPRGMRELRVSFFLEEDTWLLTPGDAGDPDPLGYVRSPEASRDCFSCHMTSLAWTRPDGAGREAERLDIERSVFGVSCERCHGPGSAHVAAVESGASDARIFNPGALDAASQAHFCGQCHRRLEDAEPAKVMMARPTLARHAGLGIALSACFRESPPASAPACLECHDPHRNIGDPAVTRNENAPCGRCHADAASRHTSVAADALADCVSCHMPKEQRGFFGLTFTSHWIRVPGAPAPGAVEGERAEYAAALESSYRAALALKTIGRERRARFGMRLGKLLVAVGRRDEGLAALRQAVTHEPLYMDRLIAADYHVRAGRHREAAAILEAAIARSPENNRAYRDLARVHLALGERSAAEGVVARWREARPGDPYADAMEREIGASGR